METLVTAQGAKQDIKACRDDISANSNLRAANDSAYAVFQQDSPALSFLDIDAAARNIRKMADYFRGKASLRPHIMVHKSPFLAHKQVTAGAITVASVKPKLWQAILSICR